PRRWRARLGRLAAVRRVVVAECGDYRDWLSERPGVRGGHGNDRVVVGWSRGGGAARLAAARGGAARFSPAGGPRFRGGCVACGRTPAICQNVSDIEDHGGRVRRCWRDGAGRSRAAAATATAVWSAATAAVRAAAAPTALRLSRLSPAALDERFRNRVVGARH